jgi:hypothetical protein
MAWLRVKTSDFNMDIREGYMHFTRALHGSPGLPMLQRQMIAVVVSSGNKCHF